MGSDQSSVNAQVRWRDIPHPRQVYDRMTAVSDLDHTWHENHSKSDGAEFTVEGLYQPHFEEGGSPGVTVPIAELGITCLTQIAGFVAIVTLPSMPAITDRDGPISLQQPYFHHERLRNKNWSGFGPIESQWGTAEPHRGRAFVQAFRVAVCPHGVPPEAAGQLVRQELPAWWSRATAWIELLSASHLRAVDDFHWSQGSAALYTRSPDGQLEAVRGRSWMRLTPRLTTAWQAPSYWPNAIQLAGLDQIPPLSCTLVVAALRAFREGEYRTCVAESGTAAEVALRDALRRVRKPAGKKETLGVVARNASNLIHGLVPDAFILHMVEVRNRVVHDGASVDAETAATVFLLAQRVVHLVHPLPEVDSSGLVVDRGH